MDKKKVVPQPTFSPNVEPVWTYPQLLNDLDKKVSEQYRALTTKVENGQEALRQLARDVKADVSQQVALANSAMELATSQVAVDHKKNVDTVKALVADVERKVSTQENNLQKTISALNESVKNTKIQVEDTDSAITITTIGKDYKPVKAVIKKPVPDNKTIIYDANGNLRWKYELFSADFDVNKFDEIRVKALKLNTGKSLTADRIYSDLTVAAHSLQELQIKMDKVQAKLSTVNGYIASNNFKRADVPQEDLTGFVVGKLTTATNLVTKETIPAGTKVKNTYDNHIWVFNRTSSAGLTTYRWEDFGSDEICIANNKGVHGLVTGSNEKLCGHIDLDGVITINGLAEELNTLMETIKELTSNLIMYESTTAAKLNNLENRLIELESKK